MVDERSISIKQIADKQRQNRIVTACVGVIVLAVIVAVFFVDYGVIVDKLKGMGFEPSADMSVLIDDIDTTSRGDIVLRASKPVLLERAEFNNTCESHDLELSVLGCYTAGQIYIYNVENEELDGVRQSTLAHELLHAVWDRMPSSEREEFMPLLQEIYDGNIDEWQTRLERYPEESFYDELHSIIGTEVSIGDLSGVLVEHYSKYFESQNKIVGYYEAYSERFQELKEEADELYAEITANQERINAETVNYNDGIVELNVVIEDFNRRAANGSFTSIEAFNTERAVLIRKQAALTKLHQEISDIVDKTNVLIEQYNNNITRTQVLIDSINSNTRTPEAEIKD
ncbi:MAG: hypothetical protein LBT19_01720 [Candidatus Nomurabacteria bacterium]|nr:hypothetical protein [Candidatus Nomurabacteria bacterium]